MKTDKKPVGRVLAVLTLFSLFVWSAWAQDASDSGSCCGCDAVQRTPGACPGSGDCPVTGVCPAIASGVPAGQIQCPYMNARINKALFLEYQGERAYFRCPRRDGVFGKEPQRSPSIRPQLHI